MTKAAMTKLIAEYTAIRSAASACVIDQLERHQSEAAGRDAIAAIDPRVSPDNASMLYTQARVWAARDGYG
jgi:hypothetical protein